MPMDYPNLDSLKKLAKDLNVPYEGKTEKELRIELAKKILEDREDVVWAVEILSGKGWDEWEEDDEEFCSALRIACNENLNDALKLIEKYFDKDERKKIVANYMLRVLLKAMIEH